MTGADWWAGFADLLPPWFHEYLCAEQVASRIETYENRYVPGVFQTADYARSVISLAHSDPVEVDRRVELRLARSARLLGSGGPTIAAVIGEAAVQRRGLTAAQVDAQRDLLVELDRGPGVEISVLPTGAGGPGLDEAFSVLTLPDRAGADLVYLERDSDARYRRDAADVGRYRELFAKLSALARPLGSAARDRP